MAERERVGNEWKCGVSGDEETLKRIDDRKFMRDFVLNASTEVRFVLSVAFSFFIFFVTRLGKFHCKKKGENKCSKLITALLILF